MSDDKYYESCTVEVIEQWHGWHAQVKNPNGHPIFNTSQVKITPYWTKRSACRRAKRWLKEQLFNCRQNWEKC